MSGTADVEAAWGRCVPDREVGRQYALPTSIKKSVNRGSNKRDFHGRVRLKQLPRPASRQKQQSPAVRPGFAGWGTPEALRRLSVHQEWFVNG